MSFVIENGVLKKYEGEDSHVVIPEGVKEIAFKAFFECKTLKTIEFPNTLTYIGGRSFEGCHNLESITIPESVTRLDDDAFHSCYKLKEVNLNYGLKRIDERVFSCCGAIEELELPEGVEYIGRYAFSNCYSLKTMIINEGVKEIWHEAFHECRKLEVISIPTTLKFLGEEIFSYYVHVTDNSDYDCYNGNELFTVPTIIYPVKLGDVKFGELDNFISLSRGFLHSPYLYEEDVAKDYIKAILRNINRFKDCSIVDGMREALQMVYFTNEEYEDLKQLAIEAGSKEMVDLLQESIDEMNKHIKSREEALYGDYLFRKREPYLREYELNEKQLKVLEEEQKDLEELLSKDDIDDKELKEDKERLEFVIKKIEETKKTLESLEKELKK